MFFYVFCVFIYIIASLWFRGKHSRKLKLFSALGVLCSFWVLLNEEFHAAIYPFMHYENHRKKHEAFKAEVNDLARRFEENGSTGLLSGELNKIIVKWMMNHIKQKDIKLSGHIRDYRAARAEAGM